MMTDCSLYGIVNSGALAGTAVACAFAVLILVAAYALWRAA